MDTNAVVDSSVIIAQYALEDNSDWASKKLESYDYLHILDLNYYEVANGFRTKAVVGSLNDKQSVETFTQAVRSMGFYGLHNFSEVIADALILALENDMAVYDGALLALALKLDSKLLTLDRKLVKKLENTRYNGLIDSPY